MKELRITPKVGLLLTLAMFANTWCALAGDNARPQPMTPQPIRFAVMADPHLYNARLGTSGSDFEAYLNRDMKLLAQSQAILESALESILQEQVNFLIIAGDLTKDGEILDHVLMAQHLAKLEQHGVQVFVVPGNHDVSNPDAVCYLGDTTRPVAKASPATFRALYQRFGYGQAIARDPASLSYVAEPVPGLWLLAIDSCKYQDNLTLGTPVIGGRISPQTMSWILARIQQARAAGKQVIAFMHHGVNEHFLPEPILFPEYLVDDWQSVSAKLAGAGLRVVFTGHYHQQDAAYPIDANLEPQLTLCDVETSSLVQYPCAFRIVTIDGGVLDIHSQRVTHIDAPTGQLSFQEFAEADVRSRLPALVIAQLIGRFGLSEQNAVQVAPILVDAIVANYAGDEAPSPATQQIIGNLLASPEPYHTLGTLLWGFWTDLPPGDNDLTIPFAFQ